MSYVQAVQRLPEEWRWPMLELVEAVRKDLREELAVRREDFDELRAIVSELAAAQRRSEQRLDRLEVVVSELAEAQKRTEQRVEELAEAQKRTEQRVEELAEAQKRTEQRLERLEIVVGELAGVQKRTVDQLSQLRGRDLERRYRENVGAYFGHWLKPVEALSPNVLRDTLEARLTPNEVDEVMRLDVLVHGRVRHAPDTPEVWLVIEVSMVMDRADVERARRRADLLQQAGYRAVAAVAGESLTEGAAEAARTAAVVVLRDGQGLDLDQALHETKF